MIAVLAARTPLLSSLCAFVAALLAVLALPSAASAAHVSRASSATPLVFGIHPGGAAGTVNGPVAARPEDPAQRAAALEQLRPSGGRPFIVHLFDEFRTRADSDTAPGWLRAQIADATARGLQVELVLRYRPANGRGDVRGFVTFVHRRVAQLGADRGLTHLQVTNEVNVAGAPDAADGAYRGSRAALVRGVIAAHTQARRRGFRHLRIGFNWAYASGPREARFFRELRRRGGRRFSRAVDWVGINAYPGTWGPRLEGAALDTAARRATLDAMRALRRRHLPRAGLRHAEIVFAESGYPTDLATRGEAAQLTVMTAVVRAVVQHRRAFRVTGLRWFMLRDADSTAPSFESQYGIMRDDYSPKAGFHVFRALVERHG